MMDIGPGDFVECVDLSPRPGNGPGNFRDLAQLRVGAIYVVECVAPPCGVLLSGIQTVAESGYYVDRFRPVYRPKADLIEGLLTPIDAEPVPA